MTTLCFPAFWKLVARYVVGYTTHFEEVDRYLAEGDRTYRLCMVTTFDHDDESMP